MSVSLLSPPGHSRRACSTSGTQSPAFFATRQSYHMDRHSFGVDNLLTIRSQCKCLSGCRSACVGCIRPTHAGISPVSVSSPTRTAAEGGLKIQSACNACERWRNLFHQIPVRKDEPLDHRLLPCHDCPQGAVLVFQVLYLLNDPLFQKGCPCRWL